MSPAPGRPRRPGRASAVLAGLLGTVLTTAAAEPTGSGFPWRPIIIVAAIIGIIAVVVNGLAARRRRPPQVERRIPAARLASNPALDARALSDTQWFHDQLSLELLVGSAGEARGRWLVERARVELLQRTTQELGAQHPDSGWPELAGAIAELTAALDTAMTSRTSNDPTTVTEAANVVNRRRQELQLRIDAVHRAHGG